MPTDRAYLTQSEYEEFSNFSVTNSTEWERQASTAEAIADAFVGPQPRFHPDRMISVSSATSTTFISPDLDTDRDDYYNGLRVRVVQGDGAGYEGQVTDYSAATNACTVSPAFSTQPNVSSVVILEQPGFFPRAQDSDVSNRPRIPEQVKRGVAAMLEYWDVKGGDAGINANVFSAGSAKASESIGSYSVTYQSSEREAVETMGQKAYDLLAPYKVRTGRITQGSGWFTRSWLLGR